MLRPAIFYHRVSKTNSTTCLTIPPPLTRQRDKTIHYLEISSTSLHLIFNLNVSTLHFKIIYQTPEIRQYDKQVIFLWNFWNLVKNSLIHYHFNKKEIGKWSFHSAYVLSSWIVFLFTIQPFSICTVPWSSTRIGSWPPAL